SCGPAPAVSSAAAGEYDVPGGADPVRAYLSVTVADYPVPTYLAATITGGYERDYAAHLD
ncbi:unnamed protein product, partial [Penicillium egyptiacum]